MKNGQNKIETTIRNYLQLKSMKHKSVYIFSFLYLIIEFFEIITKPIEAGHICLDDDYTNDLPIFIEKRSICNYEGVPVLVYSIKLEPDLGLDSQLCLKGELFLTDFCSIKL